MREKHKKLSLAWLLSLMLMGMFSGVGVSEIEKSEGAQTWNISPQVMPEKNDASVANAWFTGVVSNGKMFIRLYNASSSQGDAYGRIWLEPRPYGFNGTIWKDLYESQSKYHGSGYQNTFSNSTHTWVYCRYSDASTTKLRFKYDITLSWEFPIVKITPRIFKDGGLANISSMIRFDLTRFTFTKVLVPNVTEPYSYSSPASNQNVTLIDDSNRVDWDANYVALYDSSHNHSLIFSWQYKAFKIDVMEDNNTGKFGYLYVTFANKTQDWTDDYVTHNSTFVSWTRTLDSLASVADLKTVFSRYANMSLTHATAITVERSSVSGNRFNIQTNVTYSDLANEWSISPTHYTPCLVHTTASSYAWSERSAFGTIYFVQSDVATGFVDLHQGFYPSWLKYAYANFQWLDSNRWLDLSTGGAWSKVKASDIYMYDHVQVLLVTCWLYQVTNNASLLTYIRDGADWVVSVMQADGNVTMNFDQNGAEKGSYGFTTVHHALAFAYDVSGNSTYLTYAERNANFEVQNNLWMHNVTDAYHTDNEIIGFTKLYELTDNSTYKSWAQEAIKDVVDDQNTYYFFGWMSSDISSSSHKARGIGYYLDQVGNDISGYDINEAMKKYLDATWVQRDDWSGQLYGVLDYLNEYREYPCHNEFALTAFERYSMYLVGEGEQIPRVYLNLIYENIDWIFGDNELSTTFENQGGIKRNIQLDGSDSPYMFDQYQTYDQANFIWALTWMGMLYEDLAENTASLYSTTAYLDTRQTYFNYSITNPFILSTTQNLTALNYSNQRLTLTISAASGTISTTRIYCGSQGEPITVTGATSWSYDSASKICTITVIQSGSQEVVLDWTVTIPGDIDGDGDVDRFDFGAFAFAFGREKGEPKYNPKVDLDGDGDIDGFDFGIFAGNYGKTI